MRRVVTATYENGVLKLSEDLPLADQQRVLVIVLPLPKALPAEKPNLERVAAMQAEADAWLRQQPAEAVRPPLQLEPDRERALDDHFDAVLIEIRRQASQFSVEEIVADIESALDEARSLSDDERSRLEAELDALVVDWATGGD